MNLPQRLRFLFAYFGRPPWDSGITPPELHAFLDSHAPGRAIDLGCGTGTNALTLAQRGWQVTGIDFVPRAIAIAKRKTKTVKDKVNLRVGDVTDLKGINGPFDLALDIGCFHGVEDRNGYLRELTRVLASGGFWLLYGFFKPDPPQPGPGLVEADLNLIHARGLTLLTRTDGFDKRQRPSAWFLFQK